MGRAKKAPINEQKKWSTEDDEYLLEMYGTITMHALMKHFGRSKTAIEKRHQKLTGTISSHLAGGLYSPPQIAEAIGVSRRTIVRWIHDYGLYATQKTIVHDNKKKALRYAIDPKSFWIWVSKNRERIKFEHVQSGAILPEPRWVSEAIQEAKKGDIYKPPTWWTDAEKKKAWELYMLGYDYVHISKHIKRPVEGVREMISNLKVKYRKEAINRVS